MTLTRRIYRSNCLNRPTFKTAAAAIAAIILSESLLSPLAQASVWAERRRPTPIHLASLPTPAVASAPKTAVRGFSIPSDAAVVRRPLRSASAGERAVFLVQDVHLNEEAQRNIGRTVEALAASGATLLALEGAFGDVPLDRIRRFADQESLRASADYLMAAGNLSGPVHAAITRAPRLRVVGVDDRAAYERNVAAIRATGRRTAEAARLEAALSSLDARIEREISPRLRPWARAAADYGAGRLALGVYADTLTRMAGRGWPALDAFLSALALEKKIDAPRVEAARDRAIELLVPRLSPVERAGLVERATAFRAGRASPADFYAGLEALSRRHGIELSAAAELEDYLRYLRLSDQLDGDAVLRELADASAAALTALDPSVGDRRLLDERERVLHDLKLARLELTAAEWARWKAINAGRAETLAPFIDFYREAERRDEAIAAGLLKAMDEGGDRSAILVAGGFHTEGIAGRLRSRGIPVIVVTPRLTRASEPDAARITVFMQEKTPLDRLVRGEKLFLAPPAAPRSLFLFLGALTALRRFVLGLDRTDEDARNTVAQISEDAPDAVDIEKNGDGLELEMAGAAVSAEIEPSGRIRKAAQRDRRNPFRLLVPPLAAVLAVIPALPLIPAVERVDGGTIAIAVAALIAVGAAVTFLIRRLIRRSADEQAPPRRRAPPPESEPEIPAVGHEMIIELPSETEAEEVVEVAPFVLPAMPSHQVSADEALDDLRMRYGLLFEAALSELRALEGVANFFGIGEASTDVRHQRAREALRYAYNASEDILGEAREHLFDRILMHLRHTNFHATGAHRFHPIILALINSFAGREAFHRDGIADYRAAGLDNYLERGHLLFSNPAGIAGEWIPQYRETGVIGRLRPFISMPPPAGAERPVRWLDIGSAPGPDGAPTLNDLRRAFEGGIRRPVEIEGTDLAFPQLSMQSGGVAPTPFASDEFRERGRIEVNGVTYRDALRPENDIRADAFLGSDYDYITISMTLAQLIRSGEALTEQEIAPQAAWSDEHRQALPHPPRYLLTPTQREALERALERLRDGGYMIFTLREGVALPDGRWQFANKKNSDIFLIIRRNGPNDYSFYTQAIPFRPDAHPYDSRPYLMRPRENFSQRGVRGAFPGRDESFYRRVGWLMNAADLVAFPYQRRDHSIWMRLQEAARLLDGPHPQLSEIFRVYLADVPNDEPRKARLLDLVDQMHQPEPAADAPAAQAEAPPADEAPADAELQRAITVGRQLRTIEARIRMLRRLFPHLPREPIELREPTDEEISMLISERVVPADLRSQLLTTPMITTEDLELLIRWTRPVDPASNDMDLHRIALFNFHEFVRWHFANLEPQPLTSELVRRAIHHARDRIDEPVEGNLASRLERREQGRTDIYWLLSVLNSTRWPERHALALESLRHAVAHRPDFLTAGHLMFALEILAHVPPPEAEEFTFAVAAGSPEQGPDVRYAGLMNFLVDVANRLGSFTSLFPRPQNLEDDRIRQDHLDVLDETMRHRDHRTAYEIQWFSLRMLQVLARNPVTARLIQYRELANVLFLMAESERITANSFQQENLLILCEQTMPLLLALVRPRLRVEDVLSLIGTIEQDESEPLEAPTRATAERRILDQTFTALLPTDEELPSSSLFIDVNRRDIRQLAEFAESEHERVRSAAVRVLSLILRHPGNHSLVDGDELLAFERGRRLDIRNGADTGIETLLNRFLDESPVEQFERLIDIINPLVVRRQAAENEEAARLDDMIDRLTRRVRPDLSPLILKFLRADGDEARRDAVVAVNLYLDRGSDSFRLGQNGSPDIWKFRPIPTGGGYAADYQLALPLWKFIVGSSDAALRWAVPALELWGLPGFAFYLAPLIGGFWGVVLGGALFALLHTILEIALRSPPTARELAARGDRPETWSDAVVRHAARFAVRTAGYVAISGIGVALAQFSLVAAVAVVYLLHGEWNVRTRSPIASDPFSPAAVDEMRSLFRSADYRSSDAKRFREGLALLPQASLEALFGLIAEDLDSMGWTGLYSESLFARLAHAALTSTSNERFRTNAVVALHRHLQAPGVAGLLRRQQSLIRDPNLRIEAALSLIRRASEDPADGRAEELLFDLVDRDLFVRDLAPVMSYLFNTRRSRARELFDRLNDRFKVRPEEFPRTAPLAAHVGAPLPDDPRDYGVERMDLSSEGLTVNSASLWAGRRLAELPPVEAPAVAPELDGHVTVERASIEDILRRAGAPGAVFEAKLGRTLIYRSGSRKIAFKIAANDARDLGREARFLEWVHSMSDGLPVARRLGLRSEYPRLVDGRARLWQVDVDGAPSLAHVYIAEASYFEYLNEPDVDEARFWAALDATMHDLGVLARHGIAHTALIGAFHVLGQIRHAWMLPLYHPDSPAPQQTGTLMDHARAALYPNSRASGLADYADLRRIDRTAAAPLEEAPSLAPLARYKDKSPNFVAANFIGEYTLAALILVGHRLHRRDEALRAAGVPFIPAWRDEAEMARLAARLAFSYAELVSGFTGTPEADAHRQVFATADMKRLVRQAAFFMTRAYVPFVRNRGRLPFPEEIYGKGVRVLLQNPDTPLKPRDWNDDLGNVNGQTGRPDLGAFHGAFPLQELLTLNYRLIPEMLEKRGDPLMESPAVHKSFLNTIIPGLGIGLLAWAAGLPWYVWAPLASLFLIQSTLILMATGRLLPNFGLIPELEQAIDLETTELPANAGLLSTLYYFFAINVAAVRFGDIAVNRSVMERLPPFIQHWYYRHERNHLLFQLHVRDMTEAPRRDTISRMIGGWLMGVVEEVAVSLADFIPFLSAPDITLKMVEESRRLMFVRNTPMAKLAFAGGESGAIIYAKLESEHEVGSFKARVSAQILRWFAMMTPEERRSISEIVVESTGNQGRAVGWTVLKLKELYPEDTKNLKAVCYASNGIPEGKKARMRELGIELRHHGRVNGRTVELLDYGMAHEAVLAYKAERIAAYNQDRRAGRVLHVQHGAPWVSAGYATMAFEIIEDLHEAGLLDRKIAVAIPVGSGGLAAGVGLTLTEIARRDGLDIEIVPVQTPRSNSMSKSLSAGRIEPADDLENALLEDGIAVKLAEPIAYKIFRQLNLAPILVSPDQLKDGARRTLEDMRRARADARYRLEGSAGLGLAALRHTDAMEGREVVISIATGGNVDDNTLKEIEEAELLPVTRPPRRETGRDFSILWNIAAFYRMEEAAFDATRTIIREEPDGSPLLTALSRLMEIAGWNGLPRNAATRFSRVLDDIGALAPREKTLLFTALSTLLREGIWRSATQLDGPLLEATYRRALLELGFERPLPNLPRAVIFETFVFLLGATWLNLIAYFLSGVAPPIAGKLIILLGLIIFAWGFAKDGHRWVYKGLDLDYQEASGFDRLVIFAAGLAFLAPFALPVFGVQVSILAAVPMSAALHLIYLKFAIRFGLPLAVMSDADRVKRLLKDTPVTVDVSSLDGRRRGAAEDFLPEGGAGGETATIVALERERSPAEAIRALKAAIAHHRGADGRGRGAIFIADGGGLRGRAARRDIAAARRSGVDVRVARGPIGPQIDLLDLDAAASRAGIRLATYSRVNVLLSAKQRLSSRGELPSWIEAAELIFLDVEGALRAGGASLREAVRRGRAILRSA